MTLQVSSGYKALILGPHAFADIFEKGCIEVYSGSQPATADYAPTGTLLGRVTVNGAAWSIMNPAAGLSFEMNFVYMVKPLSDVWQLSVFSSGTAGWFRLKSDIDTDEYSYEQPRIDGAAGTSATELVLQNAVLIAGTKVPFDQFLFTYPPVL